MPTRGTISLMLRPRHLLQPAERYPADPRAVFILALSVFSGLLSLAAEESPGTLESTVPEWGIVLWGVGLGFGSLLALLGLTRDTVNGIVIEQVGSVMVGVAAMFYSAIALWVVGGSAGQPVMIILGWGIACLIRWIQLQLLLNRMHRNKLAVDIEQITTEMIDSHARTEDPDQ